MPYTAILVPFYGLGLSPAESSLVNQVRQLLLHEIINDLDGLLKTFLGGACNVEVQRGMLY